MPSVRADNSEVPVGEDEKSVPLSRQSRSMWVNVLYQRGQLDFSKSGNLCVSSHSGCLPKGKSEKLFIPFVLYAVVGKIYFPKTFTTNINAEICSTMNHILGSGVMLNYSV